MTSLAVVTPTYAPDFELFRDLHRSVLDWTPSSVVHYAIVPKSDRALFSRLQGPRLVLWSADELLPRGLVAVPRANVWVNLRRPFPPIRGWIVQQILKLGASAHIDADVLLFIDSDVVLARPLTADEFLDRGQVILYRQAAAVDECLPRHLAWHGVARKLLGLPSATPPLHDYVTCPMACEPKILTALLERVQESTGRHWVDAVGSQLHFSEWTVYGVFVDEVVGRSMTIARTDDTRCHNFWDTTPLDPVSAAAFVGDLKPTDRAIMISAKSNTPLEVRRAALANLRARTSL